MNNEKAKETKQEVKLKDLLLNVKMNNWLIYIGIGFYFLAVGIAFMCASLFWFFGKLSFNMMKNMNKKIDADIAREKKKNKKRR